MYFIPLSIVFIVMDCIFFFILLHIKKYDINTHIIIFRISFILNILHYNPVCKNRANVHY